MSIAIFDSFLYRFGTGQASDIPHPDADWKLFFNTIKKNCKTQKKHFDTITHKMKPWVDLNEMQKCYGKHRVNDDCILL